MAGRKVNMNENKGLFGVDLGKLAKGTATKKTVKKAAKKPVKSRKK